MAALPEHTVQAIANIMSRESGVPAVILRELARQESSFDPTLVGGKGEIGLVQIFLTTAREVGFTGSRADLFDPQENMRSGALYLAKQFKRFGSWEKALSAYNAGPGRVERGYAGNLASYARPILQRAGMLAAGGSLALFAILIIGLAVLRRH